VKTPAGLAPAPTTTPRTSLLRCLALACLLFSAGGAAWGADATSLKIAMKTAKAGLAPRVVQDELVLSVKPTEPAHSVGVRFAVESWAVLHLFEQNEYGVFVYDWPIPEGVRDIRYRVVIDGQVTTDPANPVTAMDATGSLLSVVTLEKDPVRPVVNPKVGADGTVTFVFTGTPGKRVAIVGDFNNWDPAMDSLDEVAPGTYSITMRVGPGTHWYYFATEGRRVLDRYNSAAVTDPTGLRVNTFSQQS
jgi:hypothetical protein